MIARLKKHLHDYNIRMLATKDRPLTDQESGRLESMVNSWTSTYGEEWNPHK